MQSRSRKETIKSKESGEQQGRKNSPATYKAAPQRVRSSPAKFQVEIILESVSDSFVALDTDWRYTYVNEKAAKMFGRTREQLADYSPR